MEQATTVTRREAQVLEMGTLYKYIYEDDWLAAKTFIDHHPIALEVEFGTASGETPLHMAAKFGRVGIVEELVRLVPPEYLEILDASGCTPLLIAATHNGVIPIATCLINKNRNALTIPLGDRSWAIPVTMALRAGLNKMGRYLYSVTPLEAFEPQKGLVGPSFLKSCFIAGELDIVLDLLRRCKELLFASGDGMGSSTVKLIASFLPSPPKKSRLFFWERCLYRYVQIPSTTTTEQLSVDIQQEEGAGNTAHQGLLHRITSCAYDFSGAKEIWEIKLKHALSEEILNLLCADLLCMNQEKKHLIEDALIGTLTGGNEEFVVRVIKANPELVSLLTFGGDGSRPQLFFHAVEHRREKTFNMLCDFRFKHVVAATNDENGNNLLHVAGLLAPTSYLNRITGPALQMQREMQWFKAVESVMQPGLRFVGNRMGMTPLNVFKENHKELRSQGEKWMKETASSCSVVAALIFTIMFAAVLSVPGGYNQSGFPVLLKEQLFIFLLSSDALSLLLSITSVFTFLGILTSHYAEEDFLYSLPRKLIIGLSALFLSIATMVLTFSATVAIMLRDSSSVFWLIIPFGLLALLPITLFAFLQFPLLVKVIYSTYSPGILKKKKKMKKWP